MKPSRPSRLRRRSSILIAALAAICALAGGTRALTPPPAMAVTDQDSTCLDPNTVYLTDCEDGTGNTAGGGGPTSGGGGTGGGTTAPGDQTADPEEPPDPFADYDNDPSLPDDSWNVRTSLSQDADDPAQNGSKTPEQRQDEYRDRGADDETPSERARRERMERQGYTPVFTPDGDLAGFCLFPLDDLMRGSQEDVDKALSRFCSDSPHLGRIISPHRTKRPKGHHGGNGHG